MLASSTWPATPTWLARRNTSPTTRASSVCAPRPASSAEPPQRRGAARPRRLAEYAHRYLLANPAPSVVAHARIASARGAAPVALELVSRHEGVAELCVVAEDHPGLLARIAAAITASRLEVLAAQVYSRELAGTTTEGGARVQAEAVDVFLVRD